MSEEGRILFSGVPDFDNPEFGQFCRCDTNERATALAETLNAAWSLSQRLDEYFQAESAEDRPVIEVAKANNAFTKAYLRFIGRECDPEALK